MNKTLQLLAKRIKQAVDDLITKNFSEFGQREVFIFGSVCAMS